MNRRSLVKTLAFLPFCGRLKAEGMNPDPAKNIKLPSGEWLNVGQNCVIRYVDSDLYMVYRYKTTYMDNNAPYQKTKLVALLNNDLSKMREKIERIRASEYGFDTIVVYLDKCNRYSVAGYKKGLSILS